MKKLLLSLIAGSLFACPAARTLDRQPNADYHARREALAKKAGAPIVLMAPMQVADPAYAFRQENNFYYLSGITVPGAGLLIAPAAEARGETRPAPISKFSFFRRATSDSKNLPEPSSAPAIPTSRKLPASIAWKRPANSPMKLQSS